MPIKIHKLPIGKAGVIMDALTGLSSPSIAPKIQLTTRAAYWIGQNRKRLELVVLPAREQFEKAKNEIEAKAKADGVPLSPEDQARIDKVGNDLAMEEVEVKIATVALSEITGSGDGRLVTIFGVIDGYVIDEPDDMAVTASHG